MPPRIVTVPCVCRPSHCVRLSSEGLVGAFPVLCRRSPLFTENMRLSHGGLFDAASIINVAMTVLLGKLVPAGLYLKLVWSPLPCSLWTSDQTVDPWLRIAHWLHLSLYHVFCCRGRAVRGFPAIRQCSLFRLEETSASTLRSASTYCCAL